MKVFVVGGAVRDALMGLSVNDRDWVVVGNTPEAMTALGFVPVGKDFPVFLHPQTREEYALARTERKTARGYKGFAVQTAPDVTLEEDLARRDLTINSIAASALSMSASAHTGVEAHSHSGFVSGFVHPLFGLDHLAAMVAVGLWSALAARKAGPELAWGPVGFAAMLLVLGWHGHPIKPAAIPPAVTAPAPAASAP